MPDYIKTGPFTNGAAPGISAAFLNALENVLEQPSGGSETGKYFIAGNIGVANGIVSQYMPSLSRTSVPVSVVIDEVDVPHTGGMNATPVTAQLSANGFQVYSLSTTVSSTNARAGGNYTLNY